MVHWIFGLGLRLSPPASLLGTFVNLKTPSPRLLQILEEGLTPPTEPILSSGSSALRRTLYDDEGLDGLRLRVNVSRFLINRARSGAEPNDIGLGLDQCQGLVDVHVMLCRRIASEVLRRILYYFETANTELTRKGFLLYFFSCLCLFSPSAAAEKIRFGCL